MSHIKKEYDDITNGNNWDNLFQGMKEETAVYMNLYPIETAAKDANSYKNRYRDVLPFDVTRVKLKAEKRRAPVTSSTFCDPESDPDYINASFVQIEPADRKYILTQGPLEHTVSDFWHMIWEQQCPAIIMLNKLNENTFNSLAMQNKCHPYVPNDEADTLIVDPEGTTVTCLTKTQMPSYIRCELEIDRASTDAAAAGSSRQTGGRKVSLGKRRVIHYQYTEWPDFGVPACPDTFLEFLGAIRASGVLDDTAHKPIAVHCSAGIGRSGTFVMVDTCLVLISRNIRVDVISLLMDLRLYRYGLVQTSEQLRFTYQAIITGIEKFIGPLDEIGERLVERQPRVFPPGSRPIILAERAKTPLTPKEGGGSKKTSPAASVQDTPSTSGSSAPASGTSADNGAQRAGSKPPAAPSSGNDKERPMFRRQAGRYDSTAEDILHMRRGSVSDNAGGGHALLLPGTSSLLTSIPQSADEPPSTPYAGGGGGGSVGVHDNDTGEPIATTAPFGQSSKLLSVVDPNHPPPVKKVMPMPPSYKITDDTPSPRPSSSSSSSGSKVDKNRTPSPTAPITAGLATAGVSLQSAITATPNPDAVAPPHIAPASSSSVKKSEKQDATATQQHNGAVSEKGGAATCASVPPANDGICDDDDKDKNSRRWRSAP